MSTETLDQERADAFVNKAMGDLAGTMTVVHSILGDRLGLFKTLAKDGQATSEGLARRVGIAERYAREWLAGMAAAGYLAYDPETTAYTLPAEHLPVLADEGGPVFFGGVYQILENALAVLEQIVEAYRTGGGVPAELYGRMFHGTERFTAGWFNHLLVPVWLPAMPAVTKLLEAGADVADVGCGRGKALITLARAFPASRYVGYDNHAPSVEGARQAAEQAGVSDRVRFEHRDISADGLPETYDVVFTFDVVHDAVDPAGMLEAIHSALRLDGRYVCVDINASHRPEENTGPVAALFYGFSTLYCLTSSLAHGGAGLGTCGFNPHTAERMCKEAGFTELRILPLENPFNNVYEITP